MEVIEYLVTQEPQVAKDVWHYLIDGKLASRRELGKKYLSYKLLLCYLSLVNKENFQTIFKECIMASMNVVQSLVYNYLHKWSNLNKICKEVMRELVDLVKVKEAEFGEFSETCGPLFVKCLEHTRNCHELSDFFSDALVSLNKFGVAHVFKHLTNDYANKVCFVSFVTYSGGT